MEFQEVLHLCPEFSLIVPPGTPSSANVLKKTGKLISSWDSLSRLGEGTGDSWEIGLPLTEIRKGRGRNDQNGVLHLLLFMKRAPR
jgi:hypothetical protein